MADEICVWSRSQPRKLLFQGDYAGFMAWGHANYHNPVVDGPNWSIRIAGRHPDDTSPAPGWALNCAEHATLTRPTPY